VAALLAAGLALAPSPAPAEGAPPSRDEYVERVEPICRRNAEANERILGGVRGMLKRDGLKRAGRQVIRASDAFGKTLARLEAVPRPEADGARLARWFGVLGKLEGGLAKVGRSLEAERRVEANHEAIAAERTANAANNVSFVFGFRYCRFESARPA